MRNAVVLCNIRMTPEEVLREMGVVLPDPPTPLANYVAAVRAGDLLFLSGILPVRKRYAGEGAPLRLDMQKPSLFFV